jgi:hypothetical protein
MADSTTELKKLKEFKIKLRYKVGPKTHYITLDKFEFNTIRNTNMIDKEKEIVKNDIHRNQTEKSDNVKDFHKELKNHLNTEDKKNYKFYIPLSSYYFTFDNFQGFLNDKLSSTTTSSEYRVFEENKAKFFIISHNDIEKKKYIKQYFEFLEKNFKDNEKYKDLQNVRIKDKEPISKYNTDEDRKQIVKEYGKYILDNEYYENSDIDKFYPSLKTDEKKLSYIITYYNIFKILETFYLSNGCILFNKFFTQIMNKEDGNNIIKKSKNKIYVSVKSIKCIKLNEELLREVFENNQFFRPIYEIEFQEIPIYSNIIFNINLIDRFNPDKKLENTLQNFFDESQDEESQDEESQDKKSQDEKSQDEKSQDEESQKKHNIIKINSESLIYKNHGNKIFSKNKNIHPTKIFIEKKLNLKELINKFTIIKKNNIILKSLGVETIKDALMIPNVFNVLKEELIKNEQEATEQEANEQETKDNIFEYYIKKFYFKQNEYLFIDNKYAQIKKITIRLLNNMSYHELINNELKDKAVDKVFIKPVPSKSTRLAIDKADTSYYVYLDVEVIYKNSPSDKIPIKDQINYANNCIGKAIVLDTLLYNALGINYPKKYLENRLKKKNNLLDNTRKKTLVKSIPSGSKTKKELTTEKSHFSSSSSSFSSPPTPPPPPTPTPTPTPTPPSRPPPPPTPTPTSPPPPQKGGANKNLTKKIISQQKNKTMKNLVHYYTI